MVDMNRPQTVQELLQWAVLFLGKEKRPEGELLLAEILQTSRAILLAYPEKLLTINQIKEFKQNVKLHQEGEPLQYLTGKQNFMGLDFEVNKNVLIPRSDTEVLVEEVITQAKALNKRLEILDLCTGSGAICVSLAKYLPECHFFATDISEKALKVARKNALAHGVGEKITFLQGNLFEPLAKLKFDFIVTNPPYISTAEMKELPGNVKREPILALWGGKEGLDFYQKITTEALLFLKKPGYLFMEIGYQQGEIVKEMCLENGFYNCVILKDWAGKDRVVKCDTSPL